MMKQTIFYAVAVLALIGTTSARGQSRDAQEKKARKACLSGDWAKGVDLLSDLFVETRNPSFIFNQGRCLEQSSRYAEAIGKFREYLRVAVSDTAEARASAERHIADCEALLDKEAGRNNAAPTTPAAAPPPEASPSLPVAATPASPEITTAPAANNAGASMRWAGIASAGAGIAGFALGVVLNIKANGIADDINEPNLYSRKRESDRSSYETWGWVSYGVGGALLVTGGVLYYLGLRERSSASLKVAPTVGPAMAGALVGGTF
jgi:hypothetical protein